jgi:hypothetical protein
MSDAVRALISEVQSFGASLHLDDGRLRVASAELLPDDVMSRIRELANEIADYLGSAVEIVPPGRTHGEQLSLTLAKAQRFHDSLLSRPPALDDPRVLFVQSKSADATLSAAAKLQAASLTAQVEHNRMLSAKGNAAADRADRLTGKPPE